MTDKEKFYKIALNMIYCRNHEVVFVCLDNEITRVQIDCPFNWFIIRLMKTLNDQFQLTFIDNMEQTKYFTCTENNFEEINTIIDQLKNSPLDFLLEGIECKPMN